MRGGRNAWRGLEKKSGGREEGSRSGRGFRGSKRIKQVEETSLIN